MEDANRPILYLINYLREWKDDIHRLSRVFEDMGFEPKLLFDCKSYDELKEQIDERNTDAIIMFFGYGVHEHLSLGEDMISHKNFGKMFYRNNGKIKWIITNAYMTDIENFHEIRVRGNDPKNIIHLHIEIDGQYSQDGFRLSEALYRIFGEKTKPRTFSEMKKKNYKFNRRRSEN